ncbi:integrase [Delftia tsuruhatensis]|uniref:site-specific integrase n=1 Tax=Delftia tsuruhatensis TaxID=180282 RepID=UPI0006425D23|nr:site-specific integrase [Delftia tsuruhatensis]KLO60180.1 integrase [Delftia tsuruhatensis]
MASIENRSRFVVTVQNCEDLTRTFSYNREKELAAYVAHLKASGYKPRLARTNDSYAIRVRGAGQRSQCLYAPSEAEAVDIKQRVELERRNGLFVDYAKGRSVTLADLLARYLREVAPRHKGFEVEGYIINAILADAGLARLDLADVLAAHKNPHPSLTGKAFRRASGKSVRKPSPATCFVRKPFADVVPEDFNDYIDDRCQTVEAPTVDREIDLFSAVCRMAIDTWRIPVAKNPMDGIRRPRYFNERDRRLKGDEETRLLTAAFNEDAQRSIETRLEELMVAERALSQAAATTYRKKALIKAARLDHLARAEETYVHVPWMETFIQFQLMTGARRSETMGLTWDNVDFEAQTAFIPESKNGRPRKLPLRSELIEHLRQLPRTGEHVFPMSVDALRKAWARICQAADLVGVDELHIHDLRHEAISRVADSGGRMAGGFSLVDLQAFSGHRDTRMLLRYTHLCMPSLARRLDQAFAKADTPVVHRGRRRLAKGAGLAMSELTAADLQPATAEAVQQSSELPSNVVQFRPRRAA